MGATSTMRWSTAGRSLRSTNAVRMELNGLIYCLQIERVDGGDWASAGFRSTVIATRERLFPGAADGGPVTTTWFELVST